MELQKHSMINKIRLMSSVILPDPRNGCGMLINPFKRFLPKHKRIIATGLKQSKESNASRRNRGHRERLSSQDHQYVSTLQQKPSPKLVPANFVGHQKHYSIHGEARMTKTTVNNETKKGDVSMMMYGNGAINKHHSIVNKKNRLVRATSGNVMIYGHLGNLGGSRGQNVCSSHVLDFLPRTAKEDERGCPNAIPTRGIETRTVSRQPNEIDHETLNIMVNEDNKNELASQNSDKSITQNKASSFRINRSTALAASGQLLEAVFECRTAIRIEPRCKEVHHLLANLYIRLGEAQKAMYHYKHAGPETGPEELDKARALQEHLQKCTEAKKTRNWNSIIKETNLAINGGATSSPQIFSLQAEAYLKLRRHEDADLALLRSTEFEVDACKKFYGPVGSANLLKVKALVDMAAGRFDDALEAANSAEKLDSKSREINMVAKKARAVAQARFRGNELFRESKFSDAYEAYDEGLRHDANNSVLLCNQAACLFKLGQYDRAAVDCSAALSLRPSYKKARLRRADCNVKMGKWEAAIKDYEELLQNSPEDEELRKAMTRARFQLSKERMREATRLIEIER